MTQAPNPNERTHDNRHIQPTYYIPHEGSIAPKVYEETNGYLPNKSMIDSGKKTLVSYF